MNDHAVRPGKNMKQTILIAPVQLMAGIGKVIWPQLHTYDSLQVTCRNAPSTHPMGVESSTQAHGTLSTVRL